MEKYYRVSDVNEILNKLAKEPYYQHDGEDFYTGVCAVEGELMCLEPVELEEPKQGEWIVCGDGDYVPFKCTACGNNTSWYHKQTAKYCPNCGAKMIKEPANE
jgi:predicted RNA-binding Zn-ribbon protein involved in translation (DUF1610 family)